jgi:hypothetical protein
MEPGEEGAIVFRQVLDEAFPLRRERATPERRTQTGGWAKVGEALGEASDAHQQRKIANARRGLASASPRLSTGHPRNISRRGGS